MALIALLIAVVLIVSAIRGTQGDLMTALRQDVPAFAIWAAALFGVAVIGYVPGLKPVSRGLLALLVVVLILSNYQRLLAAFQGVAYGSAAQAAASGVQVTGYTPRDNSSLLVQLASLVGQVQSGQSGDYTSVLASTSTDPSVAAAWDQAVAQGSTRTRTV